MHTAEHDGIRLRAKHSLPEWAPPLAAAVFASAGRGPGSHLFADLVASPSVCPADWVRSRRRDRLSRLLETPVEVDGRFLMRAESRPATKRYDKTKSVVVEPGRLSDDAPAAPRQPAVGATAHLSAAPFALAAIVEDLVRRVAVLEARPAATTSVQPVAPALPAADPPCPERFLVLSLSRRRLPRPTFTYIVGELEENLARLHERLGLPAPPRGPVAAEHGLADVAERGLRAYRAARAVLVGLPDLDDLKAPDDALRVPVAGWEEVGARLSWASLIISRVSTSRDDREIRRWRAPELEDHQPEE